MALKVTDDRVDVSVSQGHDAGEARAIRHSQPGGGANDRTDRRIPVVVELVHLRHRLGQLRDDRTLLHDEVR